MRSTIAIALVLALSACGFLEQIQFNGSSLDPNKIYLSPTNVISVAPREAHRYACAGEPMLCVQRGIAFECSCP